MEALFTVASFSKTLIRMGPFTFQKTVRMTFFTDRCARNFFFQRICVSTTWTLSIQVGSRKYIFKAFKDIIQLKLVIYSLHILLIQRSFHLSVTKKMMTDISSSLEHYSWYAAILNKSKHFCEIKVIFCYKPIQNNAEFTSMTKDFEKKKLFKKFTF